MGRKKDPVPPGQTAKIGVGASSEEGPDTPMLQAQAGPPTPSAASVPVSFSYNFEKCPTRLNHIGPYHEADVLAAIIETQGNLGHMSALLGRRRGSIRDYILAHAHLKDVYDEQKELILDKAERALYNIALFDNDPATLRYILSTQGRDRGWGQKVEHTGANGEPLQFELKLSDKPGDPLPGKVQGEDILMQSLEYGDDVQ